MSRRLHPQERERIEAWLAAHDGELFTRRVAYPALPGLIAAGTGLCVSLGTAMRLCAYLRTTGRMSFYRGRSDRPACLRRYAESRRISDLWRRHATREEVS